MIKKIFIMSFAILMTSICIGFNEKVSALELSSKVPILIQSDSSISEATNRSGDMVKFHVVNSVKDINGNVILAAGAPVQATIIRLENKKRLGRPTSLNIGGFSTILSNGKAISLSGSINKKSESRMVRSIALSAVLLPFFLLMKGAEVELPAGSQTTVYPAMDYSF